MATAVEDDAVTLAQYSTANQLENIKVAVRLRPFTERERQKSSQRIVDIEQNTVALYCPRQVDTSVKRFTFDHSYWSHDGFKRDENGVNIPDLSHPNCDKYVGQAKVFDDLGEFLLSNALGGYNSALLAYGQTGSGKSYTVSGYGQNEGILPRFARALFEELDKRAQMLNGGANRQQSRDSDSTSMQAGERDGDSSPKSRYEVCFSMLEIYNEVVRDLLAKSHGLLMSSQAALARRGLKVREHPKKGFFVENLTSYSCANKEEIEQRIEEGHLNKSIAATSMNETSSRGHTIYEFKIKQYRLKSADNPEETLTTSVVQLVDLAGSERMAVHVTGGQGGQESFVGSRSSSPPPSKSGDSTDPASAIADRLIKGSSRSMRVPTSASSTASSVVHRSSSTFRKNVQNNNGSLRNSQQQRFKESVSINQSLSALGNCIQVLSQYSQQIDSANQSLRRHKPKIPYRDSMLTKLLNTCCLSGNSKVAIIATLSPADVNYDDTLSTLRFADRAKQIRTHARVNRLSQGQIVNALQRENERLKQMIDGRVTRSDDSSQTSNFDDSENMLENFNGPRAREVVNTTPSIDAMVTPMKNRAARRDQDRAKKNKRLQPTTSTKQTTSDTRSNPSLASSGGRLQQSVSPASGSKVNQARMPKSRSVAHGLDNYEDLDEVGLIDEHELGDIKEGLLSSGDSEESFGAIEVEGLSDEDKIGLFNRLLSNSKIASKLEQTAAKGKIPRPRKTGRPVQVEGIQSVSMLSSSLKKTNPYLSNLNPDEQLTGMISYIIKQGETSIGKSDECDIVLHGAELRAKHAKVTRTSEGSPKTQRVFIEPLLSDSDGGLDKANVALMVNGAQIVSRVELNHCDRLLLGSNIYFVFIDNSSVSGGDTIANADLVTFDMARNEVLRKFMSEAKNEAMIKEINNYVHRPGTGKQKSNKGSSENEKSREVLESPSKNVQPNHMTTSRKSSQNKGLKLTRSITVDDESPGAKATSLPVISPEVIQETSGPDGDKGPTKLSVEEAEEYYRDKLMEDTYEFAMPVAEVSAVAKEMGVKVSYGLKILTSEEQLPEQSDSNYFDSNTSDGFSSSSLAESDTNNTSSNHHQAVQSGKSNSHDDRVTTLKELDSLDIPPALFIQVHLDEQDIDFYWSKEKFQARRFKILELYGSWDLGGKSGLVEYLIDQSRMPNEYLIDPFIDDPATTLILIGHSQITLQPISHLADIEQTFDVFNFNDELVGTINVQAIPCHPERQGDTGHQDPHLDRDPFRIFDQNDLDRRLIDDPQKLLGKKLVFMLKIVSCSKIPERYTNIFCQYTLNRDEPSIRTHALREDSLELDGTDDNRMDLSFNHSHFFIFERVDQDTLNFLNHGFLTIQVVGRYKLSDRLSKSPTVITTIIRSINKYKYKLDQQSSQNSYSGSVYGGSNTDSAKSRRDPSSGINNSGASSVVSTAVTSNLFDQQNGDDENINGISQENIIDMILTKRKLDRAENQLHYLKRTVNIAEHYNKKHIPVKTVKKLLSSYGHELDTGGLEEVAADVTERGKSHSNKNSGCSIQ